MDIHNPKPWHGVREFLKEYVIIVVGVLTALAAEQGVEWVRWRERAEEGRSRLLAEVHHHYLVAEERVAVQPCLDRQLTLIEDRVLASGPTFDPLPLDRTSIDYPEVYRAPGRSLTESAWQGVISEGIVSHFTETERTQLPIHYSQFDKFREQTAEEDGAVGSLMALSKPVPMDSRTKTSFVGVIEQERLRNAMMAGLSKQMMRRLEKLGYQPDNASRRDWLKASATLKYCSKATKP